MALQGGHTFRRTYVVKRPRHTARVGSGAPSPRHSHDRRGSATFGHQTSVFPESSGEEKGEQPLRVLKGTEDEEEEVREPESPNQRRSHVACHFLVENKFARRLLRVCAVLNLISLVLSAPLRDCNPEEGEQKYCKDVFIQFIIITILDSLLAVVYTIYTQIWFQYSSYQCWYWIRKQV